MYRWISSLGHWSSSVQDPSNVRKYSIYPPQQWGSQDRKAAGPGCMLEGCTQHWLYPSSSPGVPLAGCDVRPVHPVHGRCIWAPGSSWQQASVTGSGPGVVPKYGIGSSAGIKQEYFSFGTNYWQAFKKRFFPPACYKNIVNGNCNLSTLNKWRNCILKLISHHQPLPNNNNCIADGPVSRC